MRLLDVIQDFSKRSVFPLSDLVLYLYGWILRQTKPFTNHHTVRTSCTMNWFRTSSTPIYSSDPGWTLRVFILRLDVSNPKYVDTIPPSPLSVVIRRLQILAKITEGTSHRTDGWMVMWRQWYIRVPTKKIKMGPDRFLSVSRKFSVLLFFFDVSILSDLSSFFSFCFLQGSFVFLLFRILFFCPYSGLYSQYCHLYLPNSRRLFFISESLTQFSFWVGIRRMFSVCHFLFTLSFPLNHFRSVYK